MTSKQKRPLTHAEVVMKGGRATLKKYGKKYYKKLSSQGGKARWAKVRDEK